MIHEDGWARSGDTLHVWGRCRDETFRGVGNVFMARDGFMIRCVFVGPLPRIEPPNALGRQIGQCWFNAGPEVRD